jgi:hypothetical protein
MLKQFLNSKKQNCICCKFILLCYSFSHLGVGGRGKLKKLVNKIAIKHENKGSLKFIYFSVSPLKRIYRKSQGSFSVISTNVRTPMLLVQKPFYLAYANIKILDQSVLSESFFFFTFFQKFVELET